jgi:hypothetical protein
MGSGNQNSDTVMARNHSLQYLLTLLTADIAVHLRGISIGFWEVGL